MPSVRNPGEPAWPTPEQAGFHHAALLYHDAARDDCELGRYLAYRPDGTTLERGAWLFDAFVETGFIAPSGESTVYGKTTVPDWIGMLDWWFGGTTQEMEGELNRIDHAIVEIAAETASDGEIMGDPPSKRKVIVTIPRPDPAVTEFGEVDGRPMDMSNPRHRVQVVGWYTQLIKERFATKGYRHLQLWGVYFPREDITQIDQEWISDATAQVRDKGLRSLWIPYWSAPGWDQHRKYGIDIAILQPGVAFRGPIDGGNASGSRIRSAAKQAAAHGLGVEIEARGGGFVTPAERKSYLQYLAEGTRTGFQAAACAWFLGLEQTPLSVGSPSYPATVDYILGSPVNDEDLRPHWSWRTIDRASEAHAQFEPRDDLTAVRVEFEETNQPWLGTVTVRANSAGTWQPVGWAWRTTPQPLDGRWQSLVVPLSRCREVTNLRVTFKTQNDSPARLNVAGLIADTAWPPGTMNHATGKAYRVRNMSLEPAYGDYDNSTVLDFGKGKLNDGQWSDSGWNSGKQIGWCAIPGSLKLIFDLGGRVPVEKIRIRTHGGTASAVNWPDEAGALLTTESLPPDTAGRGCRPCTARYAPATPPVVTGGAGTTDQSGYIDLVPPAETLARWALLTMSTNGWVMLDEIEILSEGVNIAPSGTYHLSSVPTPVTRQDIEADNYFDDGTRLTNGRRPTAFSGRTSTGWLRTCDGTVTVDLGSKTTVRTATAWATVKPEWGVEPPASISVEVSVDGIVWRKLGAVTKGTTAPDLPEAIAYQVHATPPTSARWIRYSIPNNDTPSAGRAGPWIMLNELEVH